MENPSSVSAAASLRNPGSTPHNRTEAGPTFAQIDWTSHGPSAPKKTAKTKASSGDIVGKVAKPAAKKSSPKKKAGSKAK